MIEQTALGAASVALLNAVREVAMGNWKPLFYVLASGAVALLVSWLAGMPDLRLAFVMGLGGSGVYTLVTKVGQTTVPAPELPEQG